MEPPETMAFQEQLVLSSGFKILQWRNTTAEYRAHWQEMHARTQAKKDDIISRCGQTAFEAYLAATEAILSGVDAGGFGHFFCLAQKAD